MQSLFQHKQVGSDFSHTNISRGNFFVHVSIKKKAATEDSMNFFVMFGWMFNQPLRFPLDVGIFMYFQAIRNGYILDII